MVQTCMSRIISLLHILRLNTWSTEISKEIHVLQDDIVITKNRVSAFCNTNLDSILKLKENDIEDIMIAGIATELAVSSTVRDAHDLDYDVTVIEDCCASADISNHNATMKILQKIAKIENSATVFEK